MLNMQQVDYNRLNARQKEGYNFQKVSAVLADYGYTTMRLLDDWEGADFIAQHIDGNFIKVQLKGRLTIDKKYLKKDLHICFRDDNTWYLFPHDYICNLIIESSNTISHTDSWAVRGSYHWGTPPKGISAILLPFKLG